MSFFLNSQRRTEELSPGISIDDTLLDSVRGFLNDLELPDSRGEIRVRLMEYRGRNRRWKAEHRVPYYLLVFADRGEGNYLNAGYAVGQIAIFLRFRGIGACIVHSVPEWMEQEVCDGMRCVAAVALGAPRRSRRSSASERSKDSGICRWAEENWADQVLDYTRKRYPEAVRTVIAVRTEEEIHFLIKASPRKQAPAYEFEAGVAIAAFVEAAEELWIDLALVRRTDRGQEAGKNRRYLVSVRNEQNRRTAVLTPSQNVITA